MANYYSSAAALLDVEVILGLTEVLAVGVYVAVNRSDINFSAVTFLTKNVSIVPRSAFRRSFIN